MKAFDLTKRHVMLGICMSRLFTVASMHHTCSLPPCSRGGLAHTYVDTITTVGMILQTYYNDGK